LIILKNAFPREVTTIEAGPKPKDSSIGLTWSDFYDVPTDGINRHERLLFSSFPESSVSRLRAVSASPRVVFLTTGRLFGKDKAWLPESLGLFKAGRWSSYP
jgi:hypothetical protein